MTGILAEGLMQHLDGHEILHGISFQFPVGVFGLLGPNGAGKTTLIRTLATILPPSGGTLHLLGYEVADRRQLRPLRRVLGYLPQRFGYYPAFTVREFVEYIALLKEMPPSHIPAAVERALERGGLLERADHKIRTLSGGMIRRLGIAQAIVNEPRLLLLDEPTVGLDPQQRVEFRALIRALGETATVLLSTHLVEDVAAACREVTIMKDGQLCYTGTPAALEAFGQGDASAQLGDTPLERGYSYVLAGGA